MPDFPFEISEMSLVQLTSPNHQDTPALFFELPFCFDIPAHVVPEFLLPEFDIAGRGCRKRTTFVSMPETAVNENNGAVFRKCQIRFARQFCMQAETQTCAMQETAHDKFGFRVLATNARHHSAACGAINNIRHSVSEFLRRIINSRTCGFMILATSFMTGTTTLLPNCL